MSMGTGVGGSDIARAEVFRLAKACGGAQVRSLGLQKTSPIYLQMRAVVVVQRVSDNNMWMTGQTVVCWQRGAFVSKVDELYRGAKMRHGQRWRPVVGIPHFPQRLDAILL